MDRENARKLLKRLSGDELALLRRLLLYGPADIGEVGNGYAAIKSLQGGKLVVIVGSSVTLSRIGRSVARSI